MMPKVGLRFPWLAFTRLVSQKVPSDKLPLPNKLDAAPVCPVVNCVMSIEVTRLSRFTASITRFKSRSTRKYWTRLVMCSFQSGTANPVSNTLVEARLAGKNRLSPVL